MAWPYGEMDALCGDVRLARSDDLPADVDTDVKPPEGAALWAGTYAVVVLWPSDETDLGEAAIAGQSWLDDVLSFLETRDRPIDGYLVLALAEPPSVDLEATVVARIEASTQVCRKQVIWPSVVGGTEWKGLAGVSVLGFPASRGAGDVDTWPEMDAEAAALWARIERSGHARVAEEDRGGDRA